MSEAKFRRIAEDIRKEIEHIFGKAGILCRIFSRGKTKTSLDRKINKGNGKYGREGKLIQDPIGVRVVLYFTEDISIAHEILSSKYTQQLESTTIDVPSKETFSVTRHNIIFNLPSHFITPPFNDLIDNTFEVQIRTILSEGWHEVEHDLRYKQPDYWENHSDLSRALNGVVATLESSEWCMRKIFDDLAYRHYKSRNWQGMLYCLLKLRISNELDFRVCNILNSSQETSKKLLRLDRAKLIKWITNLPLDLPLSLTNIIFAWNFMENANTEIREITPNILIDAFSQSN